MLLKNYNNFNINFKQVSNMALSRAEYIIMSLLPNGKCEGNEWIALNPRRIDRSLGSFKINLRTGKWCDFATGDRGRDLISLVAFIKGISQHQAAQYLLDMLGGLT
ncbi:MAG: hypothetical protein V4591_11530 [Bdellovibrionota bacterium]